MEINDYLNAVTRAIAIREANANANLPEELN